LNQLGWSKVFVKEISLKLNTVKISYIFKLSKQTTKIHAKCMGSAKNGQEIFVSFL